MSSIFGIFLVELIAHRAGASYLKKQGLKAHDPHSAAGLADMSHTTHGLHVSGTSDEALARASADVARGTGDLESGTSTPDLTSVNKITTGQHAHTTEEDNEILSESAMAKILGVAILEFGVIFHSTIIGLTLAVANGFTTLFIVIVFHRESTAFILHSVIILLKKHFLFGHDRDV